MAAMSDYKVFNDPIHGLVELHPLLVKIIDTPQFQRLRNIKQLGGTSYVYPGATHSRFEHSIGVAYLAGELVQALMENQQELKITLAEKLCVQIAGLCHDLGHGPFSHLYDGKFIPEIKPKSEAKWKHEIASVQMFDHLVKVNDLEENIRNLGLKQPKELDKKPDQFNNLDFIKKLINTEYVSETEELIRSHFQDKSFLYEIVANKRNGIDVDKWDYFARDCHYLGIKNSFDYRRLILCARVCKVEGRTEICFRDKEVFNLYDMFYTRFCLHKRAYQHKVANAVECMITDAFVKAYKHIQIRGSREKTFNLYEAKDDMEAYTKLTDDVFEQILNHPNPKGSMDLEQAKLILDRIHGRDLYKCLAEFHTKKLEITKEAIRDVWEQELKTALAEIPQEWKKEDFLVDVIKLDYGMEKKDPIQHVRFYRKKEPEKPIQFTREPQNEEIQEPPIKRINLTREVSHLLPETFAEKTIRIYYKGTKAEILKAAKDYFEGVDFKKKFQRFLKQTEEEDQETQEGAGGTAEVSSKTQET
ncbi:deoxynucleoside triphosphate triphosphohydrolase SAMHD1-like isoform X1 [Fundulus heteroclitus]|uniref:deoxynucleoside triphosphate triphosphohydrolase SAMHD1-like isoform X1 n=2 Tax=Fundulus heteroclitus TaxID=8078 RepID=UPI00165A945F|nr:deoxynucleoside triphosphate triphosphohydrolase SAMHD1-like isoform X1 [Fundulus heteroclitus]XP_035994533.1 deoxynucleoside triphosphate triphosphohydrolase SAMHD1-like isoform X1 [Fundulus heteroclitus]XP_035994534.1 deoxynucleoside triphosphate triphosphohydrolase SAMHD1-like isoform X1 [Fundulus heteroclitus]XP_035994535.1 deoxynucleoside triphosphate triphosphohydrolase SAMHD1-like isoform X1 [Fundulus heteroclitus]